MPLDAEPGQLAGSATRQPPYRTLATRAQPSPAVGNRTPDGVAPVDTSRTSSSHFRMLAHVVGAERTVDTAGITDGSPAIGRAVIRIGRIVLVSARTIAPVHP